MTATITKDVVYCEYNYYDSYDHSVTVFKEAEKKQPSQYVEEMKRIATKERVDTQNKKTFLGDFPMKIKPQNGRVNTFFLAKEVEIIDKDAPKDPNKPRQVVDPVMANALLWILDATMCASFMVFLESLGFTKDGGHPMMSTKGETKVCKFMGCKPGTDERVYEFYWRRVLPVLKMLLTKDYFTYEYRGVAHILNTCVVPDMRRYIYLDLVQVRMEASELAFKLSKLSVEEMEAIVENAWKYTNTGICVPAFGFGKTEESEKRSGPEAEMWKTKYHRSKLNYAANIFSNPPPFNPLPEQREMYEQLKSKYNQIIAAAAERGEDGAAEAARFFNDPASSRKA